MSVIRSEIRTGAYYDSAFLMQLQRSLNELPGIQDAGVMMGTESNKEMLVHINLVSPEVTAAKPDDLVIVVRADSEALAVGALGQVDDLIKERKSSAPQREMHALSLETADQRFPGASWVMISVAGRYAAGVARDALRRGKHVFLFSDNVSVDYEIDLKKMASEKGLLVMGPDCGTAIIGGIGLGFANKVRKGPIGVIAAAGTGLQHVTSRIHQLGSGITYGIGTGGRDLSEKVGATTFKQGIDILARDPDTKVIVLVSKPPAPRVADEVLKVALKAGKPVVVEFIGRPLNARQVGNLHFATGLDEAAEMAVEMVRKNESVKAEELGLERFAKGQRYLRGLYSGGTLAYEAQYILQNYLPKIWANAPLNKENKIPNSLESQEHTIIDLGEDEFTVGRLHPMMDNELRIRRLYEEAKDPEVAVILLDVVIGYGSHIDPASEIAPAIKKAKEEAKKAGRYLEVIAVATGTDEDPQDLDKQIQQLKDAGAWVSTSNMDVVSYAGQLLQALNYSESAPTVTNPADLSILQKPLMAINLGLESFAANIEDQDAPVIHVEWRPPAGGNEKLMTILEKMRTAK
jgi:FdrA protein